jgi:hypothetical protein
MRYPIEKLKLIYIKYATFPALMYGLILCLVGFFFHVISVLLGFIFISFGAGQYFLELIELFFWYNGILIIVGLTLIIIELSILLPQKRKRIKVRWDPVANTDLTVVLTAYNDESSIGLVVEDFRNHPKVRRVIVIDNKSTDKTSSVAKQAGAIVVYENKQGYGNCVYRALEEGLLFEDTPLTLLCEGDMTFRAYDIDKFLSFIPHADIVNGTRIIEQLRDLNTQVTTFIYYGNFFMGKLLEAKHIGAGTLTDVGTTYKLCRNSAIKQLLPLLDRNINLEFNAYFLDQVLNYGFSVVECPVSFHARIGQSKGGNINNWHALKVGSRMFIGITLGWRCFQWLK